MIRSEFHSFIVYLLALTSYTHFISISSCRGNLGTKHELDDLDLSSFHYLDHHIHREHDCESLVSSSKHSPKGPSSAVCEKIGIRCAKDNPFKTDTTIPNDKTRESAHQNTMTPQDQQLTPKAIAILTQWILSPQNIIHPYPTLEEKKELMIKADIGEKQLKQWLSRARWKILEPMLGRSEKRGVHNDTDKRDGGEEHDELPKERAKKKQKQEQKMTIVSEEEDEDSIEYCNGGSVKPKMAVKRKDNGIATMKTSRNKTYKGNLKIKPKNNSFITKLRTILQMEDPSIIEWIMAGQAFIIRDRDRFIRDILGKYFRHCKVCPLETIDSSVFCSK